MSLAEAARDSRRFGPSLPADRAYATWKEWDAGDFGLCSRHASAYFEAELRHAGLPMGATMSILEIGFGNGAFLGWARSSGHRIFGVETSAASRERARFVAIPAYERIVDLPNDERFDAIVAFDVLEHVARDELPSLLGALGQRLKADGRIIARFPNAGSPFGLHYQHGDLTHVTALSSGAVAHLAALTGLELVHCGAPRLPLAGVGLARWVRRRLQLALRGAVEFAVRQIYFDGLPVCLAPNLVAVLRKPSPASVARRC